MRKYTAHRIIHQDIADVWGKLCRTGYAAEFMESFSPLSRNYKAVLQSYEQTENKATLDKNDVVEVQSAGGKRITFLHVDTCEKTHTLTYTNKKLDGSFEGSFIMKSTFKLKEYGEKRTKVTLDLVLIMNNVFLEFLTLASPMGIYYGFSLNSAIKKLAK